MTTHPSEQIMTDTPAERGLVFEPIPQARLQEIRAVGVDEAGNRLTVQTDTDGGSPLRCCLRELAPGTRGAYAERGPVFIHAECCGGYLTPDRYPPALSHRQQVVRAYDRDGRIADGVLVHNGEHAMTAIRELLARPDVTLVHLRNVGYGCYNFAVRRG
jgi:Protein of unknown function (DUF1203)